MTCLLIAALRSSELPPLSDSLGGSFGSNVVVFLSSQICGGVVSLDFNCQFNSTTPATECVFFVSLCGNNACSSSVCLDRRVVPFALALITLYRVFGLNTCSSR
jgi:hypothetical protein